MRGCSAIGIISDYEDQPLIINSRHGRYAIVMVGVVHNAAALESAACRAGAHFSEMNGNEVNPTELIAHLIHQGSDFLQTALRELGPGEVVRLTAAGVEAMKEPGWCMKICDRLNLTSLQFQTLDDLIEAIGLPEEKLRTYGWTGKERSSFLSEGRI